ncbi:heavy metal translocating P-type ATPase [Lentibacillus cibarius]|uniref:Cd(2+)-exporting ATPase n=1 Tax=Lentibacillus cibarius TaxID=2583219 RepID=A0A549YGF9_9BACI|nr:heavy metal translocating P-type ATPase [Lentibacillus cibarius]TRM10972.1 heavy metal translocating P-type ATPase [Lentibacillus cibarius]
MQRYLLSKKNQITLISAILIVLGFFGRFVLENITLFNWSLIVASILGIAPIAIQAYQALKVKVVSIDVLVTIAVVGAVLIKNYEESAIVTFLFLFGAYLEQRTLNQTRSAIKELTDMAPETAMKQMEDGEFEEVDVSDVDEGDILLVRTGSSVPVDGTVLSGEGHVNEASVTGESVPVGKKEGGEVFAGTILENGTIQVQADRVGEDTTFGRIIELVEDAQDSKSEAERFIDRFSKYYTPAILGIAIIIWLFTQNTEMAITALVLGCPGALVIGVPVSNVSGIGNGARNNVLLKGSEVINDFSRVDTIVFDKTGTLTVGNPEVADKQFYGENIDEALGYLASVERESDHPLAQAVLDDIGETTVSTVEATEVVKGEGVVATVNGHHIAVGNAALMERKNVTLNEQAKQDINQYEKNGNSLVLTAVDGELKILMGIRDKIRPGVKEELQNLKNLGAKNLIVLSGDNQGTVDAVANEIGLTEAHGHMLPEDKSDYIKKLQAEGQIVAFVGDGINDSPSLALADIGVAMGSGTDVAIETSDVVLMQSDFNHLAHALGLTKAISRNMKQNIAIAIGVVIVLFSGLFFSDWMNMSIGMLAHEGSILIVILNGIRLLRYRLRNQHA